MVCFEGPKTDSAGLSSVLGAIGTRRGEMTCDLYGEKEVDDIDSRDPKKDERA